ncbi:MAG: ERAP1-like C-terminal domain-containing protein, partial [Cystobacter sp.]
RLLTTDSQSLSGPERVALLGDVRALAGAGTMPVADALGLLPGLAGEKDPAVFLASLELMDLMRPALLSPPRLADRERLLRELHGARALTLGFVPRAGEDEDTRLLRPLVLDLAGRQGGEPRLVEEARRLTDRWLGGERGALPAEMVETTLGIAASRGDAGLHARMLEVLRAEPERRRREQIIAALGAFPHEELIQRNLALLLDPALDVREVSAVLFRPPANLIARDAASAFVKAHYDALAARLPQEWVALLSSVASTYCDPVHRQAAAAFFTERMAQAPGGPRTLASVLEAVDLCIAFKAAQGPGVESFLSSFRPKR